MSENNSTNNQSDGLQDEAEGHAIDHIKILDKTDEEEKELRNSRG